MQSIIREAISQKAFLESARPGLSEMLVGRAMLNDLLETGEKILPFNCVFYDERTGSCKIFEHRPLLCRAYGSALYPSQTAVNQAFSKLLPFLLYKSGDRGRVIIRRPTPLIYFFSLIFKDEAPEEIPLIGFCDDIMSLDEEEYIKKLIYGSGA